MKSEISLTQRRKDAKVFRITTLLCLLLLVACQSQKKVEDPNRMLVKVAQVVSGQTIEVVGIGEQPSLITQVRLLNIDAPDLQQRPWGDAAKQRLEALIGGEQSVMLEFDVEVKDSFGRTLAYAWKDRVLLNEQLLKEGHGLFAPRSPNNKYDRRLERAQQWARLIGEGIWNPQKPMRLTPGEFRRQYR
jgi:micrococcal nuclease